MNIEVGQLPREGRNVIGRLAADIYDEGCVATLPGRTDEGVILPARGIGCVVDSRIWIKAVGGPDVQVTPICIGVAVDGEIQPVDGERCEVLRPLTL
jgi:hypothetical protein